MKNGKISESVLKRSVLKQLHTTSDRILFKPAVGEDCAVISMQAGGQTKLVTATQTFMLDVSDKHVRANCAVYDALNNIYAMGAGPIGIELARTASFSVVGTSSASSIPTGPAPMA